MPKLDQRREVKHRLACPGLRRGSSLSPPSPIIELIDQAELSRARHEEWLRWLNRQRSLPVILDEAFPADAALYQKLISVAVLGEEGKDWGVTTAPKSP